MPPAAGFGPQHRGKDAYESPTDYDRDIEPIGFGCDEMTPPQQAEETDHGRIGQEGAVKGVPSQSSPECP